MYEKIKKLREFICKGSTQTIIGLIFTVIFILVELCSFASNGTLDDIFSYPEEIYQSLEEEADILIRTKSFETNYELVITNYNLNNGTLTMELSSGSTKLDIKVTNYRESNQKYETDREYDSAKSYILTNTFFILLIAIVSSAIILLIILSLVTAIQFVAFIIDKIIKLVKRQ